MTLLLCIWVLERYKLAGNELTRLFVFINHSQCFLVHKRPRSSLPPRAQFDDGMPLIMQGTLGRYVINNLSLGRKAAWRVRYSAALYCAPNAKEFETYDSKNYTLCEQAPVSKPMLSGAIQSMHRRRIGKDNVSAPQIYVRPNARRKAEGQGSCSIKPEGPSRSDGPQQSFISHRR